jgi:hypothetical protein
MRAAILEVLDTDVLDVSMDKCACFLDPLIDSWDIDLATFGMEVVLDRRVAVGPATRFEFVERQVAQDSEEEPGFREFLRNASLSGDATQDEIMFLKRLSLPGKRPNPLYYYRELQNLKDPLHFRPAQIEDRKEKSR